MKKEFKFKPVPPFKSYEEEADFWDNTSVGKNFNFAKAVKEYTAMKEDKVEKKDTSMNIRMSSREKLEITELAKSQKRKATDMVRILIEKGKSAMLSKS